MSGFNHNLERFLATPKVQTLKASCAEIRALSDQELLARSQEILSVVRMADFVEGLIGDAREYPTLWKDISNWGWEV